MSTEQGASELMMTGAHAAMMRERLAEHPELIPEAVANHYANLAATACHLRKIIEMRRYAPKHEISADVESCIAYLTKQITDAHYHDFGTPLFPK